MSDAPQGLLPTASPTPVLLVEDDEALAKLLASHLEGAGFAVTVAGSIVGATRHMVGMRGTGCAVLVTDQMLPDGRGADLLRAARSAGVGAPAIFLSAFLPSPELRAELIGELGVARIVRKPVTPGQVVRLVREVAAPRESPPEGATGEGQDSSRTGEGRAERPDDDVEGASAEAPALDLAASVPRSDASPPVAPASALAARIAALRRDYAGAARAQAQELLDAWVANEADVHPEELVREVRAATHKLHGTAGSYGLHDVSAAAADVEALAERVLALRAGVADGEAQVPTELLVRIGAELARLVAAAHEAAAVGGEGDGEGEGQGKGADTHLPEGAGSNVAWSVLVASPSLDPAARVRVRPGERAAAAHVRTEVVRDPRALEEAAARGPFDAVLLEHGFGGEALAAAADSLRTACLPRRPPLVILGPPSIDARVAAARAGADAYLVAPLSMRTLLETLPRIVPGAGAKAPGTRPRPVALALDDDVTFLAVLAAMAQREGVAVEPLQEPRAIFQALERLRPSMVFCDLHMPGLGGDDVCRMIRADPTWSHMPVHVLTASRDPEDRARALAAGADSVLSKPLAPAELHALLKRRARVERELRAREDRDTLTGLWLRAPFLDRLWRDLPALAERGAAGSLVLLDVTHLRSVEEQHGLLASEDVLRHVGRVLRARCRAEDATCRWSGERFAVWLPLTRPAAARGVAARLAGAVASVGFSGGDGAPFHVALHVGVAAFPEVGPSPEDLVRAAARDLDAGRDAPDGSAPAAP